MAGTKNATYCYDANGNQTEGDGRAISYSAFDKPTKITKGTNIVRIKYGPDRSRFKRRDETTSGATTTVYAMGGAYESIQRPDRVVEQKHHIGGVVVVSSFTNTKIATTRYLLKDNLGSLDTITDEVGTIVQKMSFDAWGKRREIDWTALSGSALLAFDTSITTRGYTGHEMLDPVGLVHMNGRVYDAEIGRFLSADPNIQDVGNFQNWNRYTYVLNNPLSYTDPSGFFFTKIFKAIGSFFKSVFKAVGSVFKTLLKIPLIRAAIQIIACAGTGPIGTAVCGVSAGLLTLAAGGSISDALMAGAMAFAQMGVWTAVGTVTAGLQEIIGAGTAAFAAVKGAIHGVVGGAISVAQGGNFMEGFAANAIGAAAGVMAQGGPFGKVGDGTSKGFLRTAAAAVSGGKFANGALTAAFAHMYNAENGRMFGSENEDGLFVSREKLVEVDLAEYFNSLLGRPYRVYQCEIACGKETLGLSTAGGAAFAGSGSNIFPAAKLGGTTWGTSASSMISRSIFGTLKFPLGIRMWAPTSKMPYIRSGFVGTSVGRLAPGVGYGILFNDARSQDFCVASCLRPPR